MGLFHAVTGPDHLSTLVTLAVNHPPKAAAWLGIRWGLGHSFGLVVVTVFIAVLLAVVIAVVVTVTIVISL